MGALDAPPLSELDRACDRLARRLKGSERACLKWNAKRRRELAEMEEVEK